jgi:hypothetical protein
MVAEPPRRAKRARPSGTESTTRAWRHGGTRRAPKCGRGRAAPMGGRKRSEHAVLWQYRRPVPRPPLDHAVCMRSALPVSVDHAGAASTRLARSAYRCRREEHATRDARRVHVIEGSILELGRPSRPPLLAMADGDGKQRRSIVARVSHVLRPRAPSGPHPFTEVSRRAHARGQQVAEDPSQPFRQLEVVVALN